jgi:hypothetical protein
MRIKQCLALLMLCLLVAGCGGPGKEGTPQGDNGAAKDTEIARGLVDPLTLLTKAEAEAILGEPLREPQLKDTKNPLGQKNAWYEPVPDATGRFIQISVIQNEGMTEKVRQGGRSAPEVYQETKKLLADVKPAPGIGDDAFFGTPGLHILKGNVYLNIIVSTGKIDKTQDQELEKRVAEKAISRL